MDHLSSCTIVRITILHANGTLHYSLALAANLRLYYLAFLDLQVVDYRHEGILISDFHYSIHTTTTASWKWPQTP